MLSEKYIVFGKVSKGKKLHDSAVQSRYIWNCNCINNMTEEEWNSRQDI
jgi:hypothetical protein